MSVIKPESTKLFGAIKMAINEIKPLERVQVVVPRDYSHGQRTPKQPFHLVYTAENDYNWDALEELQMDFRGSTLKPNVFVTLRFDQKDESGDVIVDICCFPS